MAIGFRQSSTGEYRSPATTAGALAVTKPTGTSSTDVVVCAWGFRGNTSVSAPVGWTPIATGAGSATFRSSAYWALGSVASFGFTAAASGLDWGYACAAFTGVDNTTPIDATGTTSVSSESLSLTANAVTVVTDQSWEVIAGIGPWNAATITATGFTVVSFAANYQQSAILYNTTPVGTGSTGTVAISVSGSATGQVLVAIPLALRPASTGAAFMPAELVTFRQAVKRAAFY